MDLLILIFVLALTLPVFMIILQRLNTELLNKTHKIPLKLRVSELIKGS